jgi:hypothetical protein
MRAVVLHDVLRSACQAGHHQVAELWRRLLAPALAPMGYSISCPAAFAAETPEPVAALLQRLGLARGPDTWARLYSDPVLVPEVAKLLDHVDAELVIGWELPPNLLRALGARGIAVVDMSIAPLRFDTDLYLRLRTNRAEWAARLAESAVPPTVFADAARRLHEAFGPLARGVAVPTRAPAVLFVGQTDLDASLIAGSTLASVGDHLPALEALLANGAPLWLKPHPHGERHADIRMLHARFAKARVVTDAIYSLLCDPAMGTVATLSSSVAEEAGWFGRRAVRLIAPDDRPGAVPGLSDHHIVSGEVATAEFWRGVLHGTVQQQGAGSGISLRRLFRLSWGWPPLPPPALPVLAPDVHLALRRGGAGQGACVFGWQAPDGDGVCSAGALATLGFRRGWPGAARVAVAVRALPRTSGGALVVEMALRPGDMAIKATIPAGSDAVLQVALPVPQAGDADSVELSFRLPEEESKALQVLDVRILDAG